ncbi:MAG: RdgB/HAM1 family non-canonical purine NTP pyrophosphatase [Candidatus Bipolaricaulota bacterium]|nr:RdgB/HAM1 family non-canonical purine NTP pyrophosphatase [Candidatus Bipolaricaulota bacterium]MCS7275026.1 RdgB/HAM1 family non-canonical purine NTP pyrophosphatase [Candidatus Bipolaricaulota bacterium]MDW8110336.1 RdgB/HAM1 family non-canonical purine NTP pyrophosphatase [Candidatus Bipolaricaulota bacterium]MDW8328768.1 RdgB/HAM1 family non-canonical purine NTP pyrophosphatase [Candidatus Bipolaricaulota bacterium]
MRLLLGTKNRGKIAEIRAILEEVPDIELLTVREQPFTDVPEDGETFEENARKKARAISQETGLAVLAEDSGLEVAALGGAPGVRSARFAGETKDDRANIAKLLELLTGVTDRRARFRCVAVLHFPDGREWIGEGTLDGQIALAPRGSAGFGYDPVFIPEGYEHTLAELGPQIKNQISHRRRALQALIAAIRGSSPRERAR